MASTSVFHGLRFFIVAAALTGCGDDDSSMDPPASLPELIRYTPEPTGQALIPEGFDFDPRRGAFIVSSGTTGTLSVVDADGGVEVLVPGSQFGGAGSFGVEVDEPRDRILVVASNFTVPTVGRLLAFSASSGALLFNTDLAALTPGLSFCNDVAVDANGIAYVTNSDQGVVYRVGLDGAASIYFQDPSFAPADPATESGFNGIVYHPNGFFLVAHASTNRIVKITFDQAPVAAVVDLPEGVLAGPDGIELVDGALVAANNAGPHFVSRLRSQDDWRTATVDGDPFSTGNVFPTAVAEVQGEVYVSAAYFSFIALGSPPANYRLVRATFDRDARSSGAAAAIAPIHTPFAPFGYGETFPAAYYAGCVDPIAVGVPDLRGDWLETTVTIGGETFTADLSPYQERIEQCGRRILFVAQGVLSEIYDANGTLFDGVNDYGPDGSPFFATAQITETGVALQPVLPAGFESLPAITRERIVDDDGELVLRLSSPMVGRTVFMKRAPLN